MNILVEYNQYKTVKYFDIELNVPFDTRYLATDGDGEVYAFRVGWKNPIADTSYWDFCKGLYVELYDEPTLVAEVDLQGMDWKETLQEIL